MKNPFAHKVLEFQVKKQDPEAFGQFYDLYVARIYRFIFFKVNSESDAQDLTSDVFLKLWHYIKEGKEVKNLNALVYMIARNAVIDFYRQKQRQYDKELPLDDASATEPAHSPLSEHINRSLMENVQQGLYDLKDEYREVIVLHYLDQLSISEIATILNKSKGSVRVVLHRALNALKTTIHE